MVAEAIPHEQCSNEDDHFILGILGAHAALRLSPRCRFKTGVFYSLISELAQGDEVLFTSSRQTATEYPGGNVPSSAHRPRTKADGDVRPVDSHT